MPLSAAADDVPSVAIDRDVASAMARNGVAGISVIVTRNGQPVFAKGYGVRDKATGAPVTTDTMFEIGSNTKHFTAAAIMQLVDAGKISLDAPLAHVLPQAPHASEVTIRQLLSHTSGIHEYLEGPFAVLAGARHHTPQDIVATIASKPLDFKPGTRWSYSNTNYILLGMVIERVSGESFLSYLHRHIFDAAGVSEAATIVDEPRLQNVSRGYSQKKPAPPLDDTYAWAAGDIVVNASQFARLDDALVNAKVITAGDYRTMTSVQTPPGGQPYGFGFIPDSYLGQPRVWHNGGTFGQSSSDMYFPTQKMRIIVLANDADGNADAVADAIFANFYPAFAAAQMQPAAGENPALTTRFKTILVTLLDGRIDRTQFDANANTLLTPAILANVKQRFASAGAVQHFVYKGMQTRGTGRVYTYLATMENGAFKVIIGTDADGKLNTIFLTAP